MFKMILTQLEEGQDYVLVTNDRMRSCSDVMNNHIRFINPRGETFLTESGLYTAMMRGRTDEAKRFSNWGTREVVNAGYECNGFAGLDATLSPPLPSFPSLSLDT
jgi:hypothetical protein